MNSDIRREYERKKSNYPELIGRLTSPVTVATGNSAAKAHGFLFALGDHGDHLEEITITVTNTFEEEYPIFFREGVRISAGFLGPLERKLARQRNKVKYRPVQFCDGKRLLDTKPPGPSMYVITAGPIDESGYFNLGLSAGLEFDSIRTYAEDPNTLVVIEANNQMPHVFGLEAYGNHRFHLSQVDFVIQTDEPVRPLPRQEPTESDVAIAEYVADLVDDGATVQFGIGALPDCVAERLREKRDLGIHTEMIGDGCMELIESGAVTNMRKTEHRGLNVATFAWGSQSLYDWAHKNECLRLLPVHEVNGPTVLARQHLMTSINSVLQVDLRGQATAHCLNGATYSGLGGHFEHTYGAQLSPGGKSILCLRSSADLSAGRVSNVVAQLAPGTGVTTPEFIIDWVVSEYGAVQLKWLALEERAEALISIAHPEFREDLEKQAVELNR